MSDCSINLILWDNALFVYTNVLCFKATNEIYKVAPKLKEHAGQVRKHTNTHEAMSKWDSMGFCEGSSLSAMDVWELSGQHELEQF